MITEIAKLEEAIEAKRAGSSGPPLGDLTVRFTIEQLCNDPPRREYMLMDERTKRPVMVRGKLALLAAKGGAGKTMSLLQLAVAVATGSTWFGTDGWETRAPGRVLLALGEEDRPEVMRRLHHVCRRLKLSQGQLESVVRNITFLPLAGVGVALTHEADSSGDLPETVRAGEIRQFLQAAATAGEAFDLVIIDPLSRFAGPDVEKDNAAATRFIQVVETFTAPECGAPAVIIAHHLRKIGKDEDAEASDLIRGSVGLVDGVRWAGVLAQMKPIEGAPDLLRLRVVKSNYAPIPEPLTLVRPTDGEGTMRAATGDEILSYGALKGGKGSAATVADNVERVIGALELHVEPNPADPRGMTREEIREALCVAKAAASAAVEAAEAKGLIRKAGPKRGYVLTKEIAQ